MRIGGCHIDGFGIFNDFDVSLCDGLTVFLGPNEAGKSTLLGFVRAMLFGFPSRRSRAPQYPPLRGGRHGGRLILCGPQGEVIVERVAARKNGLRLNGREGMDEDLRAVLGGADENVFCSVFAFSLLEMQSLEWIQADQVGAKLKLAQAEAERYVSLVQACEKWSEKSDALSAQEAELRRRQRE